MPKHPLQSQADPETVWIQRDSVTCTQTDQEALDAFNTYVRGPLHCSVMETVGSELHVPYRMCLVATLPMIFYSPVDILQCDDDCRSHHGLPSLERGFLAEMLSWLVVGLLVFPTFYPIFLRMLKHAFSAQSKTLRFVLAALGAIATFVYGYLCNGMVCGLTENIFQPGMTGIMLYILLNPPTSSAAMPLRHRWCRCTRFGRWNLPGSACSGHLRHLVTTVLHSSFGFRF